MPPFLEEWLRLPVLGNPLYRWLAAFFTFYAALFLTRVVIEKGLKILADRGKNTTDFFPRAFRKMAQRTSRLFLYAFAVWLGTQWLEMSGRAPIVIERVAILFLLFQGALWTSAAIDALLERAFRDQESEPAHNVLRFVTKFLIYVTFLLVALNNVGVNITALVTGLGVGGIAVALALQNILGDLFASLTIALDKPFVPGDFIVVGEYKGTIERVGLKTTRIRSLSGEELIFPNAGLLQSQIRNFKRMQERRVEFKLGLRYETPPDILRKIPALIQEIIGAREGVRFERAHLIALGDASLSFEVIYWMLTPDFDRYTDVHQEILLQLLAKLPTVQAELAYPTTASIHTTKQK